MKYFGIYLLDEAKSAKNRPHDHLYTRIHGIWYDLAHFDHPGGPIALHLTKDRDGTVLFESHHLLSKLDMRKILSKYKVPSSAARGLYTIDPRDNGGHYTWDSFHDDAFVKDLKELLHSYFGAIAKRNNCSLYQATKANTERWSLLSILALGFVTTLPYYINGHYWALLVLPALVHVLVFSYWHDSLHFSMSQDWRINASLPYLLPGWSSPWLWYHQHVIGHHAYTNVAMKDPDIAHSSHFKREHQSVSWNKIHAKQGSVGRFAFIWIITNLWLNLICDLKTNINLSYNNVVGYNTLSHRRLLLHIIGRMIYSFIMFIWPILRFPLSKAVIWIAIPNIIISCLFMINTQINHSTEECSHGSNTNFLKHQVLTAQNFGCNSMFCFLFSGGLNFQIEHHLFPFVNHCHLPWLAPKVKVLCKKHGVDYNEAMGYRDAFNNHLRHILELAKDPALSLTK